LLRDFLLDRASTPPGQEGQSQDSPILKAKRGPLILGLWAIPASIAVSQTFLSVAALLQIIAVARRKIRLHVPPCFWFWLAWAGLECIVWAFSPEPARGWSEIRHLLVLGVMIFTLIGFDRGQDLLTAWKGIFVAVTVSSLFLIGQFLYRLQAYGDEIASGGDPNYFLRSGGLLHHWMVYGTIEVMAVAGFIAFWSAYPMQRLRLLPLVVINAVAIVLSLTRMTWITALVLLAIHLAWRRSKWILLLPLIPVALYAAAPGAVRSRITGITDMTYFSNAERLQMLAVGWRMVRDHPLTGVGPGRVEQLYEHYLASGDPVPAYHGHLHNNALQLTAQFGVPVLVAALVFVVVVFRDLLRARQSATGPDRRFLAETAILALIGFLFAGMFEYTYGHSLALMLIAFCVFPSLSITSAQRG
jgi:O-antigen ligase